MNIRLSEPDLFFDKRVEAIAKELGCYCHTKWAESWEVRFILVAFNEQGVPQLDKPATYEQHDQVIAKMFLLDPHARVRTARVTHKGAASFYEAKQGLEPAPEDAGETL